MNNQKIGYIAKDIESNKYILETVLGNLRGVDDIDEATIYITKETFLKNKNRIEDDKYAFIKVDYGIKILEEGVE